MGSLVMKSSLKFLLCVALSFVLVYVVLNLTGVSAGAMPTLRVMPFFDSYPKLAIMGVHTLYGLIPLLMVLVVFGVVVGRVIKTRSLLLSLIVILPTFLLMSPMTGESLDMMLRYWYVDLPRMLAVLMVVPFIAYRFGRDS